MVATDHNLKIYSSALEYCVVVTSGTALGPPTLGPPSSSSAFLATQIITGMALGPPSSSSAFFEPDLARAHASYPISNSVPSRSRSRYAA